MQTHQNRRRRYFIDTSLQGKLIGLSLLLIFLVGAATFAMLVLAVPDNGGAATGTESIAQDISNIMLVLIFIVILAVFVTILYGVRLSHRIVGPIYAFNRHLNWIRDGIYVHDMRLREKDEFKNLSKVFNTMQAALRRRSQQSIDACVKTSNNLNELQKLLGQDGLDIGKAATMLEGLKADLETLRNENEKFLSQP